MEKHNAFTDLEKLKLDVKSFQENLHNFLASSF